MDNIGGKREILVLGHWWVLQLCLMGCWHWFIQFSVQLKTTFAQGKKYSYAFTSPKFVVYLYCLCFYLIINICWLYTFIIWLWHFPCSSIHLWYHICRRNLLISPYGWVQNFVFWILGAVYKMEQWWLLWESSSSLLVGWWGDSISCLQSECLKIWCSTALKALKMCFPWMSKFVSAKTYIDLQKICAKFDE